MAKVLVVDDSQHLRLQLRQLLEGAGYEVAEAQDGLHGLETVQAAGGAFDLILCDINMPRMDGLTMCDKLRQAGSYAGPIFMITTESSPEMKAVGKAAGVVAWLTKPINPERVLAGVNKLLARKDKAA
jgi:two-component system chemotaxis response regulator CheY